MLKSSENLVIGLVLLAFWAILHCRHHAPKESEFERQARQQVELTASLDRQLQRLQSLDEVIRSIEGTMALAGRLDHRSFTMHMSADLVKAREAYSLTARLYVGNKRSQERNAEIATSLQVLGSGDPELARQFYQRLAHGSHRLPRPLPS